jgi:hypothetical protein
VREQPGGPHHSYLADGDPGRAGRSAKFLKALKNSDIEALTFPEQLTEGVREGWITAEEKVQLEQLRVLTWDAISVDDFDSADLESAACTASSCSSPSARVIAT